MSRIFPRKTTAIRRIDKYRWLRSDGTPNFDDRIYRKTEDMEILAKRPVETISSSTPIIEALEKMSKGYRSLVVVRAGYYLEGLVVATDFVNYLGGGDYFSIVVNRHGKNIFSATRNERVATLMNKTPIVAYIDEKFPKVLEKMVIHGIGIIPVVTKEGQVYGIITERDILEYLSAGTTIGLKVSEVMSSPVITIDANSTLKHAMETMIKYGFRRIPVVKNNIVEGIVTAMDIVKFFGTHEAFKRTVTGNIEEILKTPIDEVMVKNVVTIDPDSDVGEAAQKMAEKNIGSLLVVNKKNELIGIITERDVLYAIAVPKPSS